MSHEIIETPTEVPEKPYFLIASWRKVIDVHAREGQEEARDHKDRLIRAAREAVEEQSHLELLEYRTEDSADTVAEILSGRYKPNWVVDVYKINMSEDHVPTLSRVTLKQGPRRQKVREIQEIEADGEVLAGVEVDTTDTPAIGSATEE